MKSLEIEKKVRLTPHQLHRIAQQARPIKEIRIQDCYFDTSDYRFTTQNMWLREREGSFELKVGIKRHNDSIDRYQEITDEKSILQHLGFGPHETLLGLISQKKLSSFCNYVTYRKSYQFDDLHIDIDEADFGGWRYQVAEIEIMVAELDKIPDAEQKIAEFIQEMNIDASLPVPAKVTYYLYCKRPEHYEALVSSKVIQPIIMDCIPNE